MKQGNWIKRKLMKGSLAQHGISTTQPRSHQNPFLNFQSRCKKGVFMAQFMRPTEINFNSNKFRKREKFFTFSRFSGGTKKKRSFRFPIHHKLMTFGGRSEYAPQMPIYDGGERHMAHKREGETTSKKKDFSICYHSFAIHSTICFPTFYLSNCHFADNKTKEKEQSSFSPLHCLKLFISSSVFARRWRWHTEKKNNN